jgi:ABC-type sugar transport system ATPase subunit
MHAGLAAATPSVQLQAVVKRFGATEALREVSLRIGEGEVVSITGPSGAGKSTLGRLISGLDQPDGGSIEIGGRDMRACPPQGRRVAHMFESFALYPTRTVHDNIASPLTAPANRGRWSQAEMAGRIDDVLALTEMTPLRQRLPSQLSGGQKQRVALCRALVQDPSVYVLDEPIGHLDAKLRHRLRGDIRRRQRALRPGTLWLTPDGLEAMAVADRMVVLIAGRVQQVGPPDEVFARPANVQVARLIGDPAMNVVSLQWAEGLDPALSVGSAGAVPASPVMQALHRRHAQQGRGLLGLRPTELHVAPTSAAAAPPDSTDSWMGSLYAVEPLGKTTIVSVDVGGQRLRAKLPGTPHWPPGTPVTLSFDAASALSFDADTGMLCP